MARKRRPARTTFHYDRQGRLRAATGPHGVTRYQWDDVRLVDVTGPTPVSTPLSCDHPRGEQP